MKHTLPATLTCFVFVLGCAPLQMYYKPGASVAQAERQTTACEVKALRDVPASTQARRTPPEIVPSETICDGAGNCRVLPGYIIPGEWVTFDPNDGLRKRVAAQCMADRGFVPVSIEPCPESIKQSVPARATKVLPKLTASSCFIRNSDDSFQIVTRK